MQYIMSHSKFLGTHIHLIEDNVLSEIANNSEDCGCQIFQQFEFIITVSNIFLLHSHTLIFERFVYSGNQSNCEVWNGI